MTATTPAVRTFTPQEARAIVDATAAAAYNFRAPAANTITAYAQAMKTGAWHWNQAAPIRLSTDGQRCSDGIHRLSACAVSGVDLRALVLYGDEWRAGINTDRGVRRTLTQYLQHENVANANQKCAVAIGHTTRVIAATRELSLGYARNVMLNDDDLIKMVIEHDDELAAACAPAASAAARGFNRTGYAVFQLEARQVDPAAAAALHADLLDQTSDPNDAVTLLRRFGNTHLERTTRRLSQLVTINGFVKAWNHRLAGDTLRLWKPPTWTGVRFPDGYDPETAIL